MQLKDIVGAIVKHDTPISGKIQEINFIYEPDLYRLVMKSKLPSAQEFERWVFEEVLPSLRKYGMYAKDEVLFDEDKFQEMKEQLKEERKVALREKSKCNSLMEDKQQLLYHVDQLQLENNYKTLDIKVLEEIVEENQEMVDYAQIIMGSKLDMTPTQIAADYGISAIRLNNLLHEANIQHKVNGQWVLYRKYMNCGYTNSFSGYHEGNDHYYIQTLWTQQGRMLIHRIMTEAGIKPICQTGGRHV
ncbi:MAG: phage antirepressor KilAC domain-containing protein [Eubacteriales bacterium]